MQLSIIIPIYNAEKYLEKCLECIFEQNLDTEDFEVICINDGSTDKSLLFLESLKKMHQNIIIIDSENFGAAHARNLGLEIAKGTYITFIDSDDQIFSNTLPLVLEKLESENLDILYPTIYFYNEDNELINTSEIENKTLTLSGFTHQRRTLPATFYRKNTIGKVRFPENVLVGEDTVFNASVQSFAKRVRFVSIPYYRYLVRPNSLSKKAVTEEGYFGFVNAIEVLDQFKKQNFATDNTEANNYFNKVMLVFITRITELHILPNYNKQKYTELKKLLLEKGYWHLAKNISEKYPYFHQSFIAFKMHQKWLTLKTKLYYFLNPSKK